MMLYEGSRSSTGSAATTWRPPMTVTPVADGVVNVAGGVAYGVATRTSRRVAAGFASSVAPSGPSTRPRYSITLLSADIAIILGGSGARTQYLATYADVCRTIGDCNFIITAHSRR